VKLKLFRTGRSVLDKLLFSHEKVYIAQLTLDQSLFVDKGIMVGLQAFNRCPKHVDLISSPVWFKLSGDFGDTHLVHVLDSYEKIIDDFKAFSPTMETN